VSTIIVNNYTDTPVSGETDLRQVIAEAHPGDTIEPAAPAAIALNAPLEITAGQDLTIQGFGYLGFTNLNSSTETFSSLSALTIDQGASLTFKNDGYIFAIANGVDGVDGIAGAEATVPMVASASPLRPAMTAAMAAMAWAAIRR
jgi:hypothetical protein